MAPGEAPSTFPSQMEADAHHQSEAESVTTELPVIKKETRVAIQIRWWPNQRQYGRNEATQLRSSDVASITRYKRA